MAKKKALGRGLNALITMDDNETRGSSYISEVDLEKIKPNPDQPRVDFDDESMEELAASIKKIGVIQPITLRELEDGTYQIIAGERRYRASMMMKLKRIPAYVKTVDDEDVMEMALVENIQREDLNAIEIALTYQKLIDSQSLTQEELSERVGKKRATIANYMRLLKLPAELQIGIKDKKIDMGHARALVTIPNPVLQLNLYNNMPGDDTTILTLKVRKPEIIDVFIGPPASKNNDIFLSEIMKTSPNIKIICGGTTALIAERELGLSLEVDIDSMKEDVPPIAYMEGFDLVTEGVLTLGKTLENIKKLNNSKYENIIDCNEYDGCFL